MRTDSTSDAGFGENGVVELETGFGENGFATRMQALARMRLWNWKQASVRTV